MTSKLVRLLPFIIIIIALSVAALAQTADTAAPLPAAPSSATSAVPSGIGTKVGTINIEQAIFASNEGQHEFETLSKKEEPKQTELKQQNDEIESLKKQLSDQGPKLNDDARGTLVKQIEQKQKSLERSAQDAKDDWQNQQNDIAQRILQKMAPLIAKYAADNGFGIVIDTSNPWPNGPVFWQNATPDITKFVVDAYNAQSGVAAPVRPAGASSRPSGSTSRGTSRPSGTPAKPAGTPATPPK
jgi:outer membrane protein